MSRQTLKVASKETKGDVVAHEDETDPDSMAAYDPAFKEKRGTKFDGRDMDRMGKVPQLRVRLDCYFF
jgi:hypothetical protein